MLCPNLNGILDKKINGLDINYFCHTILIIALIALFNINNRLIYTNETNGKEKGPLFV